jgi:hypothetical protein
LLRKRRRSKNFGEKHLLRQKKQLKKKPRQKKQQNKKQQQRQLKTRENQGHRKRQQQKLGIKWQQQKKLVEDDGKRAERVETVVEEKDVELVEKDVEKDVENEYNYFNE